MKNKLIYILLLVTFSVGCEKTWDDHYGYEDDPRIAAASLTAWEALNIMSGYNDDKYSKFITLLERVGYDKVLNSNRMLTVWAPIDEYIPDEVMQYADSTSDSILIQRFVKNHLNSLPLFKTKIVVRDQINTLAGKSLEIDWQYINGYQKFYIDNNYISIFDIACTNGVIHQINGVLPPLQNVGEYLDEAGKEYKIFRDSMNGRVEKKFSPELSFPIGVNDFGQTIYDSSFIYKNSLLRGLQLHDEEDIRTLCLPSDIVIHNALVEIKQYMSDINRPFTAVDTATCLQWIMEASILYGKVDDYSHSASYFSAYGAEIRPAMQLVKSDYQECSNGNVYIYENLYIPRSIFMYNAEVVPVNFLEIAKNEVEIEKGVMAPIWQYTENATFKLYDENQGRVKFLEVGGKVGDHLEFRPVRLNKYSEPEAIKLMPGKYAVYGQFFGWGSSASTKLKINGKAQKWYKDGGEVFPTNNHSFEYTTYPVLVDTLWIKPQEGYSTPTIRFEATSAAPIRIQRMKFQAVGKDNY